MRKIYVQTLQLRTGSGTSESVGSAFTTVMAMVKKRRGMRIIREGIGILSEGVHVFGKVNKSKMV